MERPRIAGQWTLAVAGGKGGSGKTTTVLGLGCALARRGVRPLLVDADVDLPDLHVRAKLRRKPGLAAVAEGAPPDQVARPSPRFPGVDVLTAGTGPPTRDRALQSAATVDRPVLFDCPAGAGPDVAAPLRVATASILVATDSPASVEDATKTARMARSLDAPPVGAVLRNGADRGSRSRLAGVPVRQIPAVPQTPLADPRVQTAYDGVLELVVAGQIAR